MSRPEFTTIYMKLAMMLAQRSTCARLQVGCVITSYDFRYVYGVGYNGNASGLPNQCDTTEPGACGCVHSETNAIINCTVSRDLLKYVFCTDSPCVACAKNLINLGGVRTVFYNREYRNTAGLKTLQAADIFTVRLGPEDLDDHRP
jgi:dCMP deaminase